MCSLFSLLSCQTGGEFFELLPRLPGTWRILWLERNLGDSQKVLFSLILLRSARFEGEQELLPDDHLSYSIYEPWATTVLSGHCGGRRDRAGALSSHYPPLSHRQSMGPTHFLSHPSVLLLHSVTHHPLTTPPKRRSKNTPSGLPAVFSLIHPLISRGSLVCGPLWFEWQGKKQEMGHLRSRKGGREAKGQGI